MSEQLGQTLYWSATAVAVVIVLWAALIFFYGLSQGQPIVPIAGLSCAVIIWLLGRGCRYLLAGR